MNFCIHCGDYLPLSDRCLSCAGEERAPEVRELIAKTVARDPRFYRRVPEPNDKERC